MGAAEKFWRAYLRSDEVTQIAMIHSIAERIEKCTVIDDMDLRIHCMASLMKSYIDDLIEALTTKQQEEVDQ